MPASILRRAGLLLVQGSLALGVLLPAAGAAAPLPGRGAGFVLDERDARAVHPILGERLRRRLRPEASPFAADLGGGRLLVKVRTARPELLGREARRLGAHVRAEVGGVASVEAPAAALEALARLPGVISIKPARAYRPRLDVSTPEVRADAAAASYGGTGRGVAVAVIDSGLDFRHMDFRNADGTSRVLAAWDQTDASGGGAGCGPGITFGRCWTKADLDADLAGGAAAGFMDGFFHGTHVAGIAAGNGLATANGVPAGTYAGVAPEADLIIVQVFDATGAFHGDLTAAYAWIEDRAADAGEPFVINMSLGTDFGPHDGTDPDEISLDALLAPGLPGRAAAVAAGNSRGAGIHAQGSVAAGGANDHPFTVPTYTTDAVPGNDAIYVDLWYEGGDDLVVSLLDPNGGLLAAAARGAATGTLCTPFGAVDLDATNAPDPDNSDNEVVIVLSDDAACAGAPPPSGQTLTLRVAGAATPAGGGYHVWSETFLHGSFQSIRFTPATESTLVGMPATSLRATSVGSYVTRSCWPTADPNVPTSCFGTSALMGSASGWSSTGPTRDGRLKPEVAAPGEWVASALTSARNLPLSRRTSDGFHWTLAGTSMASPHAAGALAVLFQLNPGLDAVQARTFVMNHALRDSFTGPAANIVYGGGKLDVAGASEALLKLVADVAVDETGALSWTGEPHSATYNVYRGDLPGSLPDSYGACLASGLSVPAYDDPAVPAPAGGFLYLVTGVMDGVEGSLGFDGLGRLRPNVSPCP